MLKRLILPAIAFLIALAPVVNSSSTQAAVSPHVVYGGITFTSNASNNGCLGTIVGVYGSSALKNYVLGTAAAYCSAQLAAGVAPANAVDVEYASGGDSCPGVDFAADDTTDPVIGVSDVFASGCTGTLARPASKIKDNNAAVNVVEAITNCGATTTSPQGGDPFSSTLVACTGAAPVSGNPAACASPLPANTFPYPNDISVLTSQLLWNTGSANWPFDLGLIGGCPGTTPNIQLRTPGSGTRATWCYNIYGVGTDNCVGNAPAGNQGGSGGLVKAICGNPYSTPPTAASDPIGTIGHTSRATVVIDPNVLPAPGANDSLETKAPIQQCGIVSLGGNSGYNQNCDPLKVTTTVQPYAGTNSDGVATCKGDLQIVAGNYQAWGYEHFDTSSAITTANSALIYGAASGTNPGGYLTYVLGNATQENRLFGFGFMRACQMQVTRSPDAGPYSLSAGATC